MSWHWLIDDLKLTRGEKAVALVLARHKNTSSRAWPSVATIARKSKYSERQTQYLLRRLEAKNVVDRLEGKGGRKRFGRGGKTAVYHLRQSQGLLFSPNGGFPSAPSSVRSRVQPTAPLKAPRVQSTAPEVVKAFKTERKRPREPRAVPSTAPKFSTVGEGPRPPGGARFRETEGMRRRRELEDASREALAAQLEKRAAQRRAWG